MAVNVDLSQLAVTRQPKASSPQPRRHVVLRYLLPAMLFDAGQIRVDPRTGTCPRDDRHRPMPFLHSGYTSCGLTCPPYLGMNSAGVIES